jgi:hypothetical protein
VGVAYLVVSSVWALGVVAEVLSAAAIGFLYVPASVGSVVCDPQGAAAPTIVLSVAVVICSVAAPARSRSIREGRASTVER